MAIRVAIFGWAAVDPEVARRVNKSEEERMGLFRNFAADPEMADFFCYAYEGLLHRRRQLPKAVKDFNIIAKVAMPLLPLKRRSRQSGTELQRSSASAQQ